MGKSILKANWKKGLKPAAINSGIRGASAVATAWAVNETIPKVFKIGESDPTKLEKYNKYAGAGMFLLGTLGEAVFAEEKLQVAAQGMATYGAVSMAGNWLMPERKKELGLSGPDDDLGTASEVVDWETVRTQMSGLNGDPLADINKTMEDAMQRTITGFDDNPDKGNWAPPGQGNSSTAFLTAVSPNVVAIQNAAANVAGLSGELEDIS